MAFEDKKIPYEILIRFDDNGTPKGAHVQKRRLVTMDGEILKDEILSAEPLALEGFPTSGLMTSATQAALASVNTLNAQIDQMADTIEGKDAEITEANRQRDVAASAGATLTAANAQLSQQLATYQDDVTRLNSEVATQKGTIMALQAQIAAMQSSASASAETPSAE